MVVVSFGSSEGVAVGKLVNVPVKEKISIGGPKGVEEALAFGFAVTVGPTRVGAGEKAPVQEVSRNKHEINNKEEARHDMAISFSREFPGGEAGEKPPGK